MAKMVEIKFNSIMAELEKLNTRLEKAQKTYEKKLAAAKKVGVAEWGDEEHKEWLLSIPKTETGWIINKEDIKKNGAWFDLVSAEDRVEELRRSIANAEKRMEKAEEKVEAYHEELNRIADLKEKELLWKLEFEQEQKEWAKDGITLEDRYSGITPKGKKFYIYGNNGWTRRSLHCFTLVIGGDVIFTSGEFWLAYVTIKNR